MLLRSFLAGLAFVPALTLCAGATDYDIGPGQTYTSLGAFPFENLQAGDTVRIHYRAEPYREKIRVRAQGDPGSPVTIRGIAGPSGERPILDGIDATTRSTDIYSYEPLQDLGLIIVYRGPNDQLGYKPRHIVLEGLELRNANAENGNSFTDANGDLRTWEDSASGIWALGIENLTLRDMAIHDCGNGLFINSKGDEATQSRDILVERCEIYGNSVLNRYSEHNIYTEAQNIIFQYNYLGPIKSGALGGNLKDRSARTIIRYNWIQGGLRLIDLVEAQDSYPFVGGLPEYGDDYVYGNILATNPGDANALVHYGGDSGSPETYRQGTLHFYNNTVRALRDASEQYRTHVFDITSNDQTLDARNNIFYVAPFTPGQPATNLQLMRNAGTVFLGVNWASPGWQLWTDNGTPIVGVVDGAANLIGGPENDPGFVSVPAGDLRLSAGSACINLAGPLDADATADFPVLNQYRVPRDGQPRTTAGAAPDLGAFEFGAEGELEGEGEPDGEGEPQGEEEGEAATFQTADINQDGTINLSELLRVIQFFNAGSLHCAAVPTSTEDGYEPGTGVNYTCAPHATDYAPQDWLIGLSELLRTVQLYNFLEYHYCPLDGTEDGYCAGPVN